MSKYDRHRYPCSYVRSGAISISAGRWPGGWSFSFAAFLQTATQQSGYRCLQDMARDLMDIKRKHRDIKVSSASTNRCHLDLLEARG